VIPALERACTARGEGVSFVLISGGVVPKWEVENHFCTEVGQKAAIRKPVRIARCLDLEMIPAPEADFLLQRATIAMVSMEL
jgi:hypothetical protein